MDPKFHILLRVIYLLLDWRMLPVEVRRDVVRIFQEPETLDELREAKDAGY